jgi:hypothetical protein
VFFVDFVDKKDFKKSVPGNQETATDGPAFGVENARGGWFDLCHGCGPFGKRLRFPEAGSYL